MLASKGRRKLLKWCGRAGNLVMPGGDLCLSLKAQNELRDIKRSEIAQLWRVK